jgi:hypothetical protein
MSKNEAIQYVNIKQYDNQLKIDNQVLKGGKIIKSDNASFFTEDTLSNDSIYKLNILQKNIYKTYLTTICESPNQKVVKSDEFFDTNFEIRRLNPTHSIAIPKVEIQNKFEYFNDTGCDYIFSPFSILNNHIISHGANANSLNILILNNKVYALVLDNNKKTVYGSIRTLTSFSDIKESELLDSNLDVQKQFDQMHLVEIEEAITSIMNEFYEQSENEIFCESVAIFYTLKQLTDQQLSILQDNIMLEIEYSKLNFNDYLFSLSKQSNASRLSFITPREKKKNGSILKWLFIISIIAGGIFAALNYMQEQEKIKQEHLESKKREKLLEEQKIKLKSVKLPNHRVQNDKISSVVLNIFDIIPYNAVLNEIQLQKKDSTFVCNLLIDGIFQKDMQPKLLKLYKKSEIILTQDNKPTFNIIVSNSGLLEQNLSIKPVQPNYRKNKFVAKDTLIQQIEAFLPKNSKVSFKSKYRSKFLTYNLNVEAIFQEPKEFFTFIEELNKKSYSIILKYPIEFAKTKKGIETTFKLQFNQFYKK